MDDNDAQLTPTESERSEQAVAPDIEQRRLLRPGLRFWLLWIAVNVATMLLTWGFQSAMSALLMPVVGTPTWDRVDWWRAINAVMSVVSVGAYALMQWLVLGRYIKSMALWPWLLAAVSASLIESAANVGLWTAVVFTVSSFLFSGNDRSTEDVVLGISLGYVVTGLMGATIFGTLQWLVLRRYLLYAGWWIVATAAPSVLTSLLTHIRLANPQVDHSIFTLLDFLLVAPLVIAGKGLVLLWLIRKTADHQERAREGDLATFSPKSRIAGWTWKIVVGVNLSMGVLLWFFYLTDFSIAGILADILFPPLTFVAGLVALMVGGSAATRASRRWARVLCIPSLLGGLSYLVMASIVFMPPRMMAGGFILNELAGERLVQEVASPDQTRVAQVYYRPAGVFIAESGTIIVRVKYQLLPFVERDILRVRPTNESGDTASDYLSWKDSDTIETRERGLIKVGTIEGEFPQVIELPIRFLEISEQVRRQLDK